jgi:hypothetical protein
MRDEKQREADRLAEERLELMPRGVRDRLDRCGLKLHLAEWHAFSMAERERLRDLPCASTEEIARYACEVDQVVRRITGKPAEKIKKVKAER